METMRHRCGGWAAMTGGRATTSGRGPVTEPQKRRVAHPEHEPGTACDPILFGAGENLCPNFVFDFPPPLINAAGAAAAAAPAALAVSAAVAAAAAAAAAAITPAAIAAAQLLPHQLLPASLMALVSPMPRAHRRRCHPKIALVVAVVAGWIWRQNRPETRSKRLLLLWCSSQNL